MRYYYISMKLSIAVHIVIQLCLILKILSQNAIADTLYAKNKNISTCDRYVMLGIVVIPFFMI